MSLLRDVQSLRLLPATILMCGVVLGVKCLDVGLTLLSPGSVSALQVTAAHAAEAPSEAHAAKGAAAPAKPPAAVAEAPIPMPPPPPPGPPPVSAAERDLLQDLRGRRVELDAREKTLTERQAVMAAAEQQLTARVAELSALQARLEQLDRDRRAHDEANWAGIVRVYETMKPRDAAAIFNDMDLTVLLQVMDRMKDTKAAPVLAAMQPDRARLLTTQLAAKRTQSVTIPDQAGAS